MPWEAAFNVGKFKLYRFASYFEFFLAAAAPGASVSRAAITAKTKAGNLKVSLRKKRLISQLSGALSRSFEWMFHAEVSVLDISNWNRHLVFSFEGFGGGLEVQVAVGQ